MVLTCILVVNDTLGGGEHDLAELTRRQQVDNLLLNVHNAEVEARADHTALVEAADELHDDLARAVVIDNLKLADVACRSKRRGGG